MPVHERTNHCPVVSIGMPVFNGELTIREALQSIMSQTFHDFEIIISDNASTDQTANICKEFASRDKRIRYIHQERNIGPVANFKYVLDASRAEFFMWAACDDIRSPDFLEVNHLFLSKHKDYVASTSPVRFVGDVFDEKRMGDSELVGTLFERFMKFFKGWHANGRFYSLIRTDTLKECPFINKSYLGADWAVILYLASRGKINRSNEGWVVLGKDGVSQSKNAFKAFRSSWHEIFLPFYSLTADVLRMVSNFPVREKTAIFLSLVKMNLWALAIQVVRKLGIRRRNKK